MSWNQKPVAITKMSKEVFENLAAHDLHLRNTQEWAERKFDKHLPNCCKIETTFPKTLENGDIEYAFYIECNHEENQ